MCKSRQNTSGDKGKGIRMNALKNKTEKKQSLPEGFLEMIVLPDQVVLFLRAGTDITGQLEEQMRHYGLQCTVDFKSPCG